MTVLDVRNLYVSGRDEAGIPVWVVEDVSFSVEAGKVLALIGESGSGKTTIALSALGYTRPGLDMTGGTVRVNGRDVFDMPAKALRQLRGGEVCYIAQSAASAFDPAMRLMDQVVESATHLGRMSRHDAEQRAVSLFELVGLPDPDKIGNRFPHEFSGGQLQRLMLVMALCPRPKLLLLDEPTTALDVTTQISVLRSISDAIAAEGTAAIYVSHDLAVVSQVADEIVVLYRGRTREAGSKEQVISAPKDPYTHRLIDAIGVPESVQSAQRSSATADVAPIVEVSGLDIWHGRKQVVHGVDLDISAGEIVALIGESGSGKTTVARAIAGIHPASGGSIRHAGRELAYDLKRRDRQDLRAIQYVPQSADTALNPRRTIGSILSRPVKFFGLSSSRAQTRNLTRSLIQRTHLDESFLDRYPQELSGGQKQRANLARALSVKPRILLCDEVTSALDSIVARKIVELLRELRDETGVSILFISHDIITVSRIADKIVVLYAGRVVESGSVSEVLQPPFHPYTHLLLLSTPSLDTNWLEQVGQASAVQANRNQTVDSDRPGCPFFNRCPLAMPGTCDLQDPPKRTLGNGHVIHCHAAVENHASSSYTEAENLNLGP